MFVRRNEKREGRNSSEMTVGASVICDHCSPWRTYSRKVLASKAIPANKSVILGFGEIGSVGLCPTNSRERNARLIPQPGSTHRHCAAPLKTEAGVVPSSMADIDAGRRRKGGRV